MGKERSGYYKQDENKRWFARVTYTDEMGKRRNLKRMADTRTEAKELLKQMIRALDDQNEKVFQSEKMKFKELADYFTQHYLKPAEYVENRKVAGLRSYDTALHHFRPVREFFDNRMLRAITYETISQYRALRLKTPTRNDTQRSIASVNRELAILRRVLGIAQRESWILRNPFSQGDSLISIADEKKRERILTKAEETNLLEACQGIRSHLRPILICALDTGMRQGEIFSLKWKNIDLDEGVITIDAYHTKTMKSRQIAMTARLTKELLVLYEKPTVDPNDLVFGIIDNVKRSFDFVRKLAGLADLRFHDLRHTAATRLVSQHLPLSEVGRVLGHTQANTTYRYVNANLETAKRAALLLDQFNQTLDETDLLQETIN